MEKSLYICFMQIINMHVHMNIHIHMYTLVSTNMYINLLKYIFLSKHRLIISLLLAIETHACGNYKVNLQNCTYHKDLNYTPSYRALKKHRTEMKREMKRRRRTWRRHKVRNKTVFWLDLNHTGILIFLCLSL